MASLCHSGNSYTCYEMHLCVKCDDGGSGGCDVMVVIMTIVVQEIKVEICETVY